MSNQYDITRHVDYTNHMRDYIKKSDAKIIIDNLRTQISKVPLQAHPDYPVFLRDMEQKAARALSTLEQELRRKNQIQDITQHPGYPSLVKYYENKIKKAKESCPTTSCPEAQSCPKQRVCPKCNTTEYTVSTIIPLEEPVPATTFPKLFLSSGPVFKLPWT
jgi:hypothetical protein